MQNPTVAKSSSRSVPLENVPKTECINSVCDFIQVDRKVRRCSYLNQDVSNIKSCTIVRRNTLKDDKIVNKLFNVVDEDVVQPITLFGEGKSLGMNKNQVVVDTMYVSTKNKSTATKPKRILRTPVLLSCCIKKVVDVDGDGHCGFRVVARSLYDDEELWQKVCQLILKQYEEQKEHYCKIFAFSEAEYEEFSNRIKCENDAVVTSYQYFTSPEMSQILADATKRIVVILVSTNASSCKTFLPLFGPVEYEKKPITLLNINGNHWVSADMKPHYLPGLDISLVGRLCNAWTGDVFNFVTQKISCWKEKFPPPGATQGDIVELDV